MIQFSQLNKAAAAGVTSTYRRLNNRKGIGLPMSSAILAQAVPTVNADDPAAVVAFLCSKYGITPSVLADDLANMSDVEWADRIALIRQEALRQSIETQRATLVKFESHPAVMRAHSRFARSESRRRKRATTCKNCQKQGKPCWQHRGGKGAK